MNQYRRVSPRLQLTRRKILVGLLSLTVGLPVLAQNSRQTEIKVWKDPNCGCCQDWVAHLEKSGFSVRVVDEGNHAARSELGMPKKYGSCHTAVVQGYVIEGHVPASDIQRLLRTRPKAIGLAVPGMPIGSPGMDGPEYGGRRDPFQVLLIKQNGTSEVFRNHS